MTIDRHNIPRVASWLWSIISASGSARNECISNFQPRQPCPAQTVQLLGSDLDSLFCTSWSVCQDLITCTYEMPLIAPSFHQCHQELLWARQLLKGQCCCTGWQWSRLLVSLEMQPLQQGCKEERPPRLCSLQGMGKNTVATKQIHREGDGSHQKNGMKKYSSEPKEVIVKSEIWVVWVSS